MHTSATARLDRFLSNPRRGMWGMALPMMIGMALQTLYMIVDMIFIGMLGSDALTAVAFDMPLVFLGLGVTFGLGSGVTAVVARYVGARDAEGADRAAENGLLLGLGLTAFFTLLGGVWGRELLVAMGVPSGLLPLAWEYFGPIVYGYVFLVLSTFLRSILAGEGDMRTPMMIQGAATLLNIALDPLFMFTFGWGVWGAAVATVVSQAAAAVAFVWLLYAKGRSYVTFDPRHFRTSAAIVGEIARLGAPASFSFLLMALGGGIFNRLLVEYSPDVVAAYQVGGRLDHVVLLPMISISTALVTLVGMFRGASRLDLVRDVVRYAMAWTIGIGAVTALLFFAIAPWMMRGFSEEAGIISAGTAYLRVIAWGYPFIGISMLAGRTLQGLGIGSPVLLFTVMRLLLIAGPLAFFLVYWVRSPVEWVWGAMLLGILVTAVVSMVWLRTGLRAAARGAALPSAVVVEHAEHAAPVA
ncbi:MAG TPA: MATE family efflux transporter [Thermoanaerobaculia bacterium]|nr:MATE family efflux transporter [Thermoanaerobaculia bacterium]